jgi:deoxyribose-phosphate aldolase
MEEIPGKQTIDIVRQQVYDCLAAGLPSFTPVTEIAHCYRTPSGTAMAAYIDHTLLNVCARTSDFIRLCKDALTWQVATVCVPPNRVPLVREHLGDSAVGLCTVVGFPSGYASTKAKVAEAYGAIEQGAEELDMVAALGWIKDGNWPGVYTDIHAVVQAAGRVPVKVILETSELSLAEKIAAAYTARLAGAAFLKTSTGFASAGAQLDDVLLLRQIAGQSMGVKAAGGIKTAEFALALIDAGADRIGASGTAGLLGLKGHEGGGTY